MSLPNTLKFLLAALLLALAGCGGGGGGGAPVTGRYTLTVLEADGTTPVADAQVNIFDAENTFVATRVTDVDGEVSLLLGAGVYTARVQAQGFAMSPPQGASAVPFTIIAAGTVTTAVNLDAVADPANIAMIRGNADTAGALVVAEDSAQGIATSALTANNGDYVLYNVAPGSYQVTAFKAGFSANTVAQTVAALDELTVNLNVIAQTLPTLSGQLTFLAVANGVVDITLRHPVSLDTIPGLGTENTGTNYSITHVPAGDYLAWATFANDGYVMDPDWVNKNGGYPDALLATVAGSNVDKDFSITGAITLDSPTNPADEVVPVVVTTLTPTFRWLSYSSTQQYVVEVFDLEGNSIWGGYDFDQATADDYAFRHPVIGTALQADYDFDASASQALENGKTYLWRVYAFKRNGPSNPWVAISASEDQMGLFRVELPPPPPP